ncbi:hypothetical protein P280DRAFT_83609 [Massarina eburnea CBS 473.64]|uniref:Uncharacterized protein n=1 Tax=Massarina eburnea CBS 473.64 TaxID=1395130 RepID=A0A6A6RRV8_9PLEO|nr:hypothetical protein P280DRAFT_83609 [Massarina eburnea CBS 473.64]
MAAYKRIPPEPPSPDEEVAQVAQFHSSQHSLSSSTSSRAPLHHLTLHEYRKQQNSPASSIAPPLGKTLRRKAAAPALNKIERVPSTSQTRQTPRLPPRPLHASQSAHQLPHQQLPPSPPFLSPPPLNEYHRLLAQPLRSQSVEPYGQGGLVVREPVPHSTQKLRKFNPTKRLPKPSLSPCPFASSAVTPPLSRRSNRRTTDLEISIPTDTQSTPSTFSLSKFPQPPHPPYPLSPPNDENLPTGSGTASFTTTAPATPPATPAVIHYRGTSFDLVNPHDSLVLHQIVTPSRDLDSTDCLSLYSSGELTSSSRMAPQRFPNPYSSSKHVKNDLEGLVRGAAELGITPPPAARLPDTPTSSEYSSSPGNTSDPQSEVAPLVFRKFVNEARSSLTHLTSFAKRWTGKLPEEHEQELQNMSRPPVRLADVNVQGEFPRSLAKSYTNTEIPTSRDGPSMPASPVSPLESAMKWHTSMQITQPYVPSQLTSMVPDDQHPKLPSSEGHSSSPYYDGVLRSYTSSGRARSNQSRSNQSVTSDWNSNQFASFSGETDAIGIIEDYRKYSSSNASKLGSNTSKSGSNTSKSVFQERAASDLSHSNFALRVNDEDINDEELTPPSIEAARGRRPGPPPSDPLGPPFRYNEPHGTSPRTGDLKELSQGSSYEDTPHLLKLSPFESSSFYSQPTIPQVALDQADQIFGNASEDENVAENNTESMSSSWLTLPEYNLPEHDIPQNNSPEDRHFSTGGSIANISDLSNRGSFDSQGFPLNDLHMHHRASQNRQIHYRTYSTPLPQFAVRTHSAPDISSPSPESDLLSPTTAPTNVRKAAVNDRKAAADEADYKACVSKLYAGIGGIGVLSPTSTQKLIESGPNDEVLYGGETDNDHDGFYTSEPSSRSKTVGALDRFNATRSNSFHKFELVGPKGNVTGTPEGTGMREVGSSLADNSSPGYNGRAGPRYGESAEARYDEGAEGTPVVRARTSSYTPPPYIPSGPSSSPPYFGPSSSQGPSPTTRNIGAQTATPPMVTVEERPEERPSRGTPLPQASSQSQSGLPRSDSRPSVHGQTELRPMKLHSDTTRGFYHAPTATSDRPSTANTDTPMAAISRRFFVPKIATYRYSSACLVSRERDTTASDEAERLKLSRIIFALCCILPPLLILYRFMGDTVIANWTEGRFKHADPRLKAIALIVGSVGSISITGAILIPVFVARSAGVL